MSFRTTLILLLVLAVLGGLVFLTRNAQQPAPSTPSPRRLITLAATDIAQIDLKTTVGQSATFVRKGNRWRITSPVNAPADEGAVDSLLSSLLAQSSQGRVEIAANAAALGLDEPAASIALTPQTGAAVVLHVGSPTGTGGNVYVRVNDSPQADLVPAALLSDLEKPISKYRDPRLIDDDASAITQMTIVSEGQTIALERHDGDWRLTQPFEAPAENSAVDDLIRALSSIRAEDFVSEDVARTADYELDAPALLVTYSTQAPSTQPAATQPHAKSLRIGRYEDLLKRSVFAMAGESGPIVKIPASILTSLKQDPLELRGQRLLDVNPAQVRRIMIGRESAATTQPTAPAMIIERRVASTTAPTQSVEGGWQIVAPQTAVADQEAVAALLQQLAPLRVNRYLQALPSVTAVDTTVIAVEAGDAAHAIRLRTPEANSFTVQGEYNGVSFEAAKSLFEATNGSFVAPPPATAPSTATAP